MSELQKNQGDLAELAHVVADLASKGAKESHCPAGERFEFAGRYWLAKQSGQLLEIKPKEPPKLNLPSVATPKDIAAVALKWCEPEETVIRVGSFGIKLQERAHQQEDVPVGCVEAPFFRDDEPTRPTMNYVELLNWMDRFPDQIGTGVKDGEVTDISPAIRACFSSLTAETKGSVSFREEGGVINVTVKDEATVVSTGVIPRYIAVQQRIGSPNFKTAVLYNIKCIKSREEGVLIQVTRVPTDGAYERWLQWAMLQLETHLRLGAVINGDRNDKQPQANWLVMQAP